MKLSLAELKFTPNNVKDYNLGVYGNEPNEMVQAWISHWKLPVNLDKGFTNLNITSEMNLDEMFEAPVQYDYVDGFSPNLNKHLHVGHLSNLVLAKAFQGLGIGKNFIAIFGDTLQGSVEPSIALETYMEICDMFRYRVDKLFFASQMKLKDDTVLISGEGEYATTKVLDVCGDKIVGIKSTGSTTYFYQDVALAQELNASTLYLTGLEQDNHFNMLHKLFPNTAHLGLGLILLDGKKMSSSDGNVIYIKDILKNLMNQFDGNLSLIYNILAGNILKSEPKSEKKINTSTLDNVKLSKGLYVSYTMARMFSAGIELVPSAVYNGMDLKLKSLKSKVMLKPNMLFDALVNACEEINHKYTMFKIKDSEKTKAMFQELTSDVVLAVNELGLHTVTKV